MHAIYRDMKEVVLLLLEAGTDLNLRDNCVRYKFLLRESEHSSAINNA
jgi:hypothetical protein